MQEHTIKTVTDIKAEYRDMIKSVISKMEKEFFEGKIRAHSIADLGV